MLIVINGDIDSIFEMVIHISCERNLSYNMHAVNGRSEGSHLTSTFLK